MHVGQASHQGGIFLGGTNQIYIKEPAAIRGVEVVSSYSLKEELLWNHQARTK